MTAAIQTSPEAFADAPPAPIIFTDSAANKVAELVAEEGNPDLKLRVFVQGGGCSGFQYGFTFDEIVSTLNAVHPYDWATFLRDRLDGVGQRGLRTGTGLQAPQGANRSEIGGAKKGDPIVLFPVERAVF